MFVNQLKREQSEGWAGMERREEGREGGKEGGSEGGRKGDLALSLTHTLSLSLFSVCENMPQGILCHRRQKKRVWLFHPFIHPSLSPACVRAVRACVRVCVC